MKVLIVDKETHEIDALERSVREAVEDDVKVFVSHKGAGALDIVREEHIDVMFLEVELSEACGLEIARESKRLYPKTNVVLCTEHERYALKAWDLFISGYIVKPVTPEKIQTVLKHLRTPIVKKLTVQCFGYFDVFVHNEIVKFGRSGAKEMLAYLISLRGASVTGGELCEILRTEMVDPDLKRASVRKYAAEIRKTLSALGLEDVLCHSRDSYSVNTKRLDCDYYRYLDGEPEAEKLFRGEFMRQYSWAEAILGSLIF